MQTICNYGSVQLDSGMTEPIADSVATPAQELTGRRPFTRENAKEMQLRAAAARRQNAVNAAAKQKENELARLLAPTLAMAIKAQGRVDLSLSPRLALVAEQIERTRSALNAPDLKPGDRVSLLNAMDKLLVREQELIGTQRVPQRFPGPIDPIEDPPVPLRGPSRVPLDPIV